MKALIVAIVIIAFIAMVIANGPASSSEAIKPFQDQVAQDFIDQYEMVREAGTDTDRCIRAQLVAEGFLQAENQEKYVEWRAIQTADCKAAGIAY